MIVSKMIRIVEVARYIYKKEALSYIRVTVSPDHHGKKIYAEVEGMYIDREHMDCWEIVQLKPSEVEPAIQIIKMINFGNERVHYLEDGVEVYVRSSPRVEQIEDSIRALNKASFYKELHQEEGCVYSCILKDTKKAQKELKKFLKDFPNVRCYYEYGIHSLYM